MQKIIVQIAQEIRVEQRQVLAAAELLDGGRRCPSSPATALGRILSFAGALTIGNVQALSDEKVQGDAFHMTSLRFRCKWLLSIAAFLTQAVWADDWISHYYEHPTPERFVAEVQGLSKSGHLSSPKTGATIAMFLGRVMAANPVAVGSWLSQLSDLTGRDRETLLLAAGFSRTQEARSFLAKQPDGGKYLESLMDIRSVEPEDPAVLDMLWADFFATGEVAPLKRIVHALSYGQYEGAMEKYASSQKTQKDREDAMRDAVFRAARWSLESNVRQHRRVGELLEKIYWKDDLTHSEQLWLSVILAKAMPEKYELVQFGPGQWSFKRK